MRGWETAVNEAPQVTILIVSPDSDRRQRATAALSEIGSVSVADDFSKALDEVSLTPPTVALIDCVLPYDTVTGLVGALGDLDRAVLWVPETQPELLSYGTLVQVPYAADDRVLVEAVRRLASERRRQLERLHRVLDVIRDVRHEINSALTAIMAESELLLMNGDGLSEEQRQGLATIGEMARRIRDLGARLRELDT